MNASRCPRCGDQHLCPGVRATIAADTLHAHIDRFVADTFVAQPHSVINSLDAWDAYQHWCTMVGQPPYSQRQFVNAMAAQPGIRRVKRSTMRFAGIGWKRSQVRGRHAAPEPV